jgi:hypothetical protein
MTADEIVNKWMEIHGPLSSDQQRVFVAKSETAALTLLPAEAVLYALTRSPKVAEVLRLATRDGWWFVGDACEQDNIEWCGRCKPNGFPTTVYMTKGRSSAFHSSRDCPLLAAGQRFVESQGGDPAPIEPVHVQVALGSGRFPCLSCFV